MRCMATGLLALFIVLLPAAADATGPMALPKGVRSLPPQPAPQFRLSDMDGRLFDLAQARGSWVFVHFWASWCRPCREEMPAIQRLSRLMEDAPLRIVLINTAEDEDSIFSFMAVVAPDMSTLMDRDGQATEAWRPRGLPATYLVDPRGVIRYQALGGRPWDQPAYVEFLRKLLQGQ